MPPSVLATQAMRLYTPSSPSTAVGSEMLLTFIPLRLALNCFVVSSSRKFVPTFLSSDDAIILPSASVITNELMLRFFTSAAFVSAEVFSVTTLAITFAFSKSEFINSNLV